MPLPCRFPNLLAVASASLVTLALLGHASLEAATLHAVVSGGLISGDLGGTPFTDASYTVTASYDPALVQSGTLAGFPGTSVGVTPTITIDTGSGLLSGTLQPFAGFTWHLFSLEITANDSRSGFAPINSSLDVTNAFDIAAAWPQSTLLAQVAFGGESNANDPATWQTTAGTLNIDSSTDAAGTFAIVPEPSTVAALGIALVALAGRRRFTKA